MSMTPLTLATVPGFVDLPDALIGANKFAMGIYFQRLLGNAKFGIVRPEVFTAQYKHGDTVTLPTSPVDGYTYEQSELIYLWHYLWTGPCTSASTTDPITGVVTTTLTAGNVQNQGDGYTVWYTGAFVEQGTGLVSSYVAYRQSNGNVAPMSNDGILEVSTIAVRRKSSLIVSATLPAWSDLADSVFAQDAAMTETLTLALNHNSKLASLRHEAIYMGEYTNGQQVPLPISPAEGYAYSYAEVIFMWCWRWTCDGAAFADPSGEPQLNRLTASIDATGHVSTAAIYINNSEYPTTQGRLTVVAMCQRKPMSTAAMANVFTDIDDSNFMSGAFPKLDIFKALDDAIRFAALRVEFFAGACTNGQTVPLPTSPIDGYAYQREELSYIIEFANTGPNADERLISFGSMINQSTGLVATNTDHLHDGGAFHGTTDGTVNVLIIARRSHVQPAVADTSIAIDGGGGGDYSATLQNGGFESWSRATQTVADAWTQGPLSGGATLSHAGGIEGASAQGFTVPAGSVASVISSSLDSHPGDLRYCGLKLLGSAATTRGMFLRVHLYNQDLSNSAYFDLLSNQAILGGGTIQNPGPSGWLLSSGTLQKFDLWYEVPAKNAAAANTSRGSAPVVGLYDFVCTYAKLEILCSNPDVAVQLAVDSITWGIQVTASAGQVGLRGALSLAFFPALVLSITNTAVTFSWPLAIQFSDGRIVSNSDAPVVLSGLTASTVYALLLYWDDLHGVYGAVAGGSGINGWAHNPADMAANARALAMLRNSPQNIGLSSGPIYFTTNAAAGAPTGGSGGGDGGCHRSDVLVREQHRGTIEHHCIRVGDHLWNRTGFTEVLEVETLPHEEWIHVDLDNGVLDLPMTSGHTFESADGKDLRAYDLSASTLLTTPTGVTSPTRIQRMHYEADIVRLKLAAPCTYYVSMDGKTWVETHNFLMYAEPTL